MNKQKVGLSLIFFVLLVLLETIYKIVHPEYSVLGIFILNTSFGIGVALYHYEDKNDEDKNGH